MAMNTLKRSKALTGSSWLFILLLFFIMLGADVFGEYLASVFAGSPEPPAQMTDIDASEKKETTFSTLFLK